MTASVTVGFAPAASLMVTAGVAAAPESEGGESGLFAALLALLGPQPAGPQAAGQQPAVSQPAGPQPTGLQPSAEGEAVAPALASPTPLLDVIDLPNAAAGTPEGKSLLKDLSDALIAINDALAAGKPIDPALETKLSDSLDAVAVYLGTMTAPAPLVDPKISALASGDGIIPEIAPALPPVPAAAGESVAPTTAPTTSPVAEPFAPAPDALNGATPETTPDLVIAPHAPPKSVAVTVPPEIVPPAATSIAATFQKIVEAISPAAAPAAVTETVAPAATETAASADAAPPALVKLAKLVEALGNTLEAQAPELAAKLQTLAKSLETGKVPAELLTQLTEEAVADPEIARIIEALSAPKPTAAKGTAAAQPFIAPTLEVPAAVTETKPATTPDPATPAPSDDADTLDAPEPSDTTAKPVLTPNVGRETRPADAEPKPASPSPQPTTAASDTSATPTAPPPQPAAIPAARTIHAAYQTPVQQVNLPQVAFEVVRQFEAGNSRFQIRLDPPELGRIDIKLDVDKSGTVNARMTVERPETLDLMQRDQRALQQALQQAGLDSSKTNLEFSLRQNPFSQQGGMGDGRGGQPGFAGRGDGFGNEDAAAEAAATTYRGTASAGGVNLFV